MSPSTSAADGSESEAQVADSTLFRQIVMSDPVIGMPAIDRIREGLPAEIIRSASAFFGVPQTRIQQIVQIPASTAGRLEKAKAPLDPAVTERLYRIAEVAHMAVAIFGSPEAATQWMRQPNPALGGVAPLDLMDTEPGAAAVRLVLNALATGGVA
jgi:putative toxin-antitoxin system antitoxin component (TIGR02293 family)